MAYLCDIKAIDENRGKINFTSHNPKVVGSNPAPATSKNRLIKPFGNIKRFYFCM